ncbi:MAG TPA: hypothetical protein VHG51_07365 [Longimicrobiaceae bacterium]|nr:hypothetical protein [Longimicrobiaceae bacterium]
MRIAPVLRPAGIAALPLLAVGCGADARAAGPVVRDSAGITVVENAAPAWREGEGWTVSAEPLLDVGVTDGDPAYQFSEVAGAVRLGAGTLVVADNGSKDLRFYDARGRHLRTAGRQGGGPGEFERVDALARLAGDSLLVWDSKLIRATVFGPDGALARVVRPAGLEGMTPRFRGAFADGAFVGAQGFDPQKYFEARPGERRDTVVYLRFSPAGALRDTLARVPGQEIYLDKSDGGFSTNAVVFGRDGLLRVAGDRFFVGDNGTYQVAEHSADGALRRLVRRARPPVEATADDVRRYHEERESRRDYSKAPPSMRAFMQKMAERERNAPHRATFPAFASFRLDEAGNLWVEDYRRPGDEQPRWSVFDPEGRWLGTVETPAGLEVYAIGGDWILGKAKDDLDVEHVRLYRLERPGA